MNDLILTDEQSTERRASTYRLLSACFHEPEQELLDRIAAAASEETDVETERLNKEATDLETLRLDYAKLFLGPFEVVAPPYGSTYLDNPERVMTESTTEVQEWYRQEGLDIGLDEPADHVAGELEFVGVLALAEKESLKAGEDEIAVEYVQKQYEFLSQHLGRWISELADNMREHAQTEFYRTLADETQSFVESDGKDLASRLEALDEVDSDALTGGECDDS